MSEWRDGTLKDIAYIEYGKSPKDVKVEYSDIPIFGTSGQVGYAVKTLFEGPLVMIGRKGTINKPLLIKGDCWIIDTAYAAKPKQNVDVQWLYYCLIYSKLEKLNEATGVPSLNRENLYNLKLTVPPVKEQQKIASILSSVDKTIEKTEDIIKQTKKAKKGLMQQLLTRGIGHTKFKKTEVGDIPCDWERVPLKNLVEENRTICYGVLKPGEFIENGIPMLRVVDLGDGKVKGSGFHRISKELDKEYSRSRLKGNEVLISLVGTIGRIAVTESYHQFMNVHRNIGIIPVNDKKINKRYLAYMMQSEMVQKEIKVKTTGGSQPLFNIGDLKELKILLPSLEEQLKIVNFISSVDKKLELEMKKQLQLEFLKVGLMQSLLTGKVRIKVDEAEVTQV
ncbi:TPA: restriction endonuclease subunit S [Bacillus cereus]